MEEVGAARPFKGSEVVRRKLLHGTLSLGPESTSLPDASPFVMLPKGMTGDEPRCEVYEERPTLTSKYWHVFMPGRGLLSSTLNVSVWNPPR